MPSECFLTDMNMGNQGEHVTRTVMIANTDQRNSVQESCLETYPTPWRYKRGCRSGELPVKYHHHSYTAVCYLG